MKSPEVPLENNYRPNPPQFTTTAQKIRLRLGKVKIDPLSTVQDTLIVRHKI